MKNVANVMLCLLIAVTLTLLPQMANAALPGDLDGNGVVSISEVQRAINSFLRINTAPLAGDLDGDGVVSQSEIQIVINAFLGFVRLKISLTGTPPAATAIAGAEFVLTLPAGLTPATLDASGSVVPSGLFSTGAFVGVNYIPATIGESGTMNISVTDGGDGITETGEIATVILNRISGAVPAISDFPLSNDSVFDTNNGVSIAGINVVVTSVSMQ